MQPSPQPHFAQILPTKVPVAAGKWLTTILLFPVRRPFTSLPFVALNRGNDEMQIERHRTVAVSGIAA